MSELSKRERVPEYHYASEQSRALIETLEDASLEAKAALKDVIDQFFIDTATWGLSHWEQSLAIPVSEGKDMDFRKSRIKSKLRGVGTTTVTLVKNVAESFFNGTVEVTEFPEQFRVEIKFVDSLGIPPNMNDLMEALREVVPAHLQLDYIIIYNTWDAVSPFTWNQLAAHTWDSAKESELS